MEEFPELPAAKGRSWKGGKNAAAGDERGRTSKGGDTAAAGGERGRSWKGGENTAAGDEKGRGKGRNIATIAEKGRSGKGGNGTATSDGEGKGFNDKTKRDNRKGGKGTDGKNTAKNDGVDGWMMGRLNRGTDNGVDGNGTAKENAGEVGASEGTARGWNRSKVGAQGTGNMTAVPGMEGNRATTATPPPPLPAENNSRDRNTNTGKGQAQNPLSGPGAGRGKGLTAPFFDEAKKADYLRRYQADVERLYARDDLPADAHWVDSHCHLESILARTWRGGGKPQVMDNEPEVDLQELVELWPPGLDACISNFVFRRPSKPGFPPEWSWLETNLRHFEQGSAVADKLWFTVGIHPHDAANWDAAAEQIVRRFAQHPKCVGIGECGLDFFKHDQREAAVQLRAFREQAKLAVELKKTLVVHGRLVTRANEELCMGVLKEVVPPEHPMHIHCYSDSLEHALELCKHWPELRIGFTGSITFKDKPKGVGKGGVVEKKGEAHTRELISGLPLERLLLETDGPYMCPAPFRGQTAHPGHVHRVAEKIAEWQRRPLGEVMAATRRSTKIAYGV